MSKIAIFGAGGHGKVVADVAELNGFNEIFFYDDDLHKRFNWEIHGNFQALSQSIHCFDLVFVAIGNNRLRVSLQESLKKSGGKFGVLTHPKSVISKYASIGEGTIIMANVVVNSYAHIGECCILNTASTVDHDCFIDHGVHICPGVNLAGGVKIGKFTMIGIGSQLKEGINIGSNVVAGAGSNIIKNIDDNLKIFGNPAIKINQ